MRHTITEFEDAMLAAVRQAAGSLARTVRIYQGELQPAAIKRKTPRLPAVFVLYGGTRSKPHGQRRVEDVSFTVLVATGSLRGTNQDGRTGAAPEASVILDTIKEALDGTELFAGEFPMYFKRDRLLSAGSPMIYAAEYQVRQAYLQPVT